jgi:hypothetical protein
MKINSKTIIRLCTSIWHDKRGFYVKKSINFLRRKSVGYNIIEEDISMDDDVISRIVNFNECKDGIYEVVMCNISYDFETDYIDSYDYKLIKYHED